MGILYQTQNPPAPSTQILFLDKPQKQSQFSVDNQPSAKLKIQSLTIKIKSLIKKSYNLE